MQDLVQSISGVQGVTGAAIFSREGSCLAHALSPPYEPILLAEALRELKTAMECYAGTGMEKGRGTLLLSFEQGRLAVRQAEEYDLVALTSAAANMAVLSVAFNVAVLRLQQSRSAPAFPAPRAAEPPRRPSGTVPPGGYDERLSQSMARDMSSSGIEAQSMNWSRSQSQSQAVATAPGAVGMKVMRHVLEVALRYFGPDARHLVEGELRRRNATPQTLTSAHFADLIVALSSRLAEEHRPKFMQEVLGDVRR